MLHAVEAAAELVDVAVEGIGELGSRIGAREAEPMREEIRRGIAHWQTVERWGLFRSLGLPTKLAWLEALAGNSAAAEKRLTAGDTIVEVEGETTEADLKRASELLFDWSDGQVALGDLLPVRPGFAVRSGGPRLRKR